MPLNRTVCSYRAFRWGAWRNSLTSATSPAADVLRGASRSARRRGTAGSRSLARPCENLTSSASVGNTTSVRDLIEGARELTAEEISERWPTSPTRPPGARDRRLRCALTVSAGANGPPCNSFCALQTDPGPTPRRAPGFAEPPEIPRRFVDRQCQLVTACSPGGVINNERCVDRRTPDRTRDRAAPAISPSPRSGAGVWRRCCWR